MKILKNYCKKCIYIHLLHCENFIFITSLTKKLLTSKDNTPSANKILIRKMSRALYWPFQDSSFFVVGSKFC